MLAALAALLVAAAAPALRVDDAADRGLPCKANAALAKALRERLPGLRLEQGADADGDDLSASLARARGGWLLELRRAGGAVALQRSLPLGTRDCALLGETGALVIDRWLEEVRWPGRPAPLPVLQPPARPAAPSPIAPSPGAPPPIAPSPAEPPQPPAPAAAASPPAAVPSSPPPSAPLPSSPAPAPPSPAPPSSAAAPPAAAPAPEREPPLEAPPLPPQQPVEPPPLVELPSPAPAPAGQELALSLGPAAWLGLPGDARFALALEAALRRDQRLRLGLTLLGTAASAEAVLVSGEARGQISVRSASALLSASLCAEAPLSLRACAGPLAGARLSAGSASGSRLFQTGTGLLLQPALGAGAWLSHRLGKRLELSLALLLAWTPGSASFTVAGGPSRTLSAVDLAAAVRLGWIAF